MNLLFSVKLEVFTHLLHPPNTDHLLATLNPSQQPLERRAIFVPKIAIFPQFSSITQAKQTIYYFPIISIQ